jgi:hypothetical protein
VPALLAPATISDGFVFRHRFENTYGLSVDITDGLFVNDDDDGVLVTGCDGTTGGVGTGCPS